MGIHNLKTFIDSHFTGWRRTEVKGHLVIDGDNVKHQLNSQDWSHGGQFHQYERSVRGFYINLRRSGITPVVVLDGIDHTGEKWSTIIKRRKERLRVIHKQMARENRDREVHKNGVYPSLAADVYIQVLVDLHIEFVVVDGEADGVIVEIANFYKCPVLSSDSDFYMYKLTGGFLPMDRLQKDDYPFTGDLYRYEDFCAQFQFQDESVRFIIPALVGNDTISPALHDHTPHYKAFIEEIVGTEGVPDHPLGVVVCYAATFDSLGTFKDEIAHLDCLSRGSKIKIKENCQKSCEIYNCGRTLCIDDIWEVTGLRTSTEDPIPPWIVKNYHRGRFSTFLFSMIVIGRHILGTFIDDTTKNSSTCISLPIRQCIYGMVRQDSTFEEYFRVAGESKISSEHIDPEISVNGCPLPSLGKISTLSHPKRENLFYSILHCEDISFSGIDDQLWLALAAAVFWRRLAQPPPHLVKSILLCFTVCFHHSNGRYKNSEEFRLSPEWMSNLHYFAQWQSCYKDSISLNQILKLPLYIISPALLYNGQLVMHLAEPPNLDRMVSSFRDGDVQLELYQRLVRVVLLEEDAGKDLVTHCRGSSRGPSRSLVASGGGRRRTPRGPPGQSTASSGRGSSAHESQRGPPGQPEVSSGRGRTRNPQYGPRRKPEVSVGRGHTRHDPPSGPPGQPAASGGRGYQRHLQQGPPEQPRHTRSPPRQPTTSGGRGRTRDPQRGPSGQPSASRGRGSSSHDSPRGPQGHSARGRPQGRSHGPPRQPAATGRGWHGPPKC